MSGDILAVGLWYVTQVKKVSLQASTGHVKIGFSELRRAGHGLCHESCTHARENT